MEKKSEKEQCAQEVMEILTTSDIDEEEQLSRIYDYCRKIIEGD